jgi:hypothetical protein
VQDIHNFMQRTMNWWYTFQAQFIYEAHSCSVLKCYYSLWPKLIGKLCQLIWARGSTNIILLFYLKFNAVQDARHGILS